MPQIASRIVDVCVFRFLHDRPEYLMMKRSHKEKLYPGLWQFVSGTIEPGERVVESALRELREEAALEPVSLWVAPHVSTFFDHVGDTVHVSPMFVAQVAIRHEPRLSPEHSDYSWLPFLEARQRLVWPAHRTGLETIHSFILTGTDAAFFSRVSL